MKQYVITCAIKDGSIYSGVKYLINVPDSYFNETALFYLGQLGVASDYFQLLYEEKFRSKFDGEILFIEQVDFVIL